MFPARLPERGAEWRSGCCVQHPDDVFQRYEAVAIDVRGLFLAGVGVDIPVKQVQRQQGIRQVEPAVAANVTLDAAGVDGEGHVDSVGVVAAWVDNYELVRSQFGCPPDWGAAEWRCRCGERVKNIPAPPAGV